MGWVGSKGTITSGAWVGHDGAATVGVAAFAPCVGVGAAGDHAEDREPGQPEGGEDHRRPGRGGVSASGQHGEPDEQDAGGGEAGGETVGCLHRLGHVEAGDEGDAPDLGPHPTDDGSDPDAEAEQGHDAAGADEGQPPHASWRAARRRRSRPLVGARRGRRWRRRGPRRRPGRTGRPRPSSPLGRSRWPRSSCHRARRRTGRGTGSSSRRTAYVILGNQSAPRAPVAFRREHRDRNRLSADPRAGDRAPPSRWPSARGWAN